MANTLTLNATRANTTKTVSFLNPATNQWVVGSLVATDAFQVVFTGIPAGTYSGLKCRLDNTNPEISATFPGSVTVADAATTPTTPGDDGFVATSSSEYNRNAFAASEPDRSAFATTDRSTDATQFQLKVNSKVAANGYPGELAAINIYDGDGNYLTSVNPSNASGVQTLTTSTIAAAGTRRLRFQESGNTKNGETGRNGGTIVGIKPLNGSVFNVVTPNRPANILVIPGDSISVGQGAGNSARYGFASLLQQYLGPEWEVVLTGAGAVSNNGLLGTEPLQTFQANLFRDFAANRTGRAILAIQLVTNDYGFSTASPAAVAGYQAATWQKSRALVSRMEVLALSSIFRTNGTNTNGQNATLPDYNTAIFAQADNFPSYVSKVNLYPVVASAKLPDGTHPNPDGHKDMALFLYRQITGVDYVAPGSGGTTTPVAGSANTLTNNSFRDVANSLTITGNSAEVASDAGVFNSSLRTVEAIAASRTGRIYGTIPTLGADIFFGLSYGDKYPGYTQLAIALYYASANQQLYVYYNGQAIGTTFGTIEATSRLSVAIERQTDNTLAYALYVNSNKIQVGQVLAAPSNQTHYGVGLLSHVGDKLTNVQMISEAALVTY